MTLRRIGVGSAAKVAGIMYAVLGLIVGLVVAVVSAVGAGLIAAAGQNSDVPPWIGGVFGVGAVVVFPVLYGVMGLIFGAITAAVYNAVAGAVGGIYIELQESGPATTAAAH